MWGKPLFPKPQYIVKSALPVTQNMPCAFRHSRNLVRFGGRLLSQPPPRGCSEKCKAGAEAGFSGARSKCACRRPQNV